MNNRIHQDILLSKEYDFDIKYFEGKDNIVADTWMCYEGYQENRGLQ